MRRLDYQEVSDILTGCTILGTGGGGSLQSGLAAVEKEFGEGKEFKLLEFMRFRMRPGLPILISAVPSCRKDRRFRLQGRKFRRP